MTNKGFTLLELLIVMALIAILAAIGYPSYTSYLEQAECRQAHIALHQLATRLEHYAVVHGSYAGSNRDNVGIDQLQQHIKYHLKISEIGANHFLLTATSTRSHATPKCDTLSLKDTEL